MTNAVKHSHAAHIDLELTSSASTIALCVRDDGCGILRGREAGGIGLKSMQYRVRALGGRFALESPPGGGTAIRVSVPTDPELAAVRGFSSTARPHRIAANSGLVLGDPLDPA